MRGLKSTCLLLGILLLQSSCSSSRMLGSEDVMKNFGLKSKEYEKFDVKPIENSNPDEDESTPPKKLVEDSPVKKAGVKKTERIKKNESVAKKNDIVEKVIEESHLPINNLPENYPEELLLRDEKSEALWSQFRPVITIGEETVIQMKYLGITVGNFTLQVLKPVKVGETQAYHIKGILKSASYYEMIYKLDDVIETFISTEDFVPLKFSLVQRESNQNVDDLQLFDRSARKVMHFYKKEKRKKKSESKQEAFIPMFYQDFLSAIYFLRGLPIENPTFKAEFPVFNKGKMYISRARFIAYEDIEYAGKKIKSIRVGATNHFPGSKENKGEMEFWFSRDEKRQLLKLRGVLKIGEIEGQVVSHIP